MNNNGKVLLWGGIATAILVALTVYLFSRLSDDTEGGGFVIADEEVTIYNGIPSDAVVVVDFKQFGDYSLMVEDTLSALYGIPYTDAGLVALQKDLFDNGIGGTAPVALSMHYSAKNSVALLQVMDLKNEEKGNLLVLLEKSSASTDKYSGIKVYSLKNGTVAAVHNDLLLASSSSYVLESSIRHLENSVSIMDKEEFGKILEKYGNSSCVYINHSQIGKLFSGVFERDFLKYSDFVMNFAGWSCVRMSPSDGKLQLQGVLENFSDESAFSNILNNQSPRKVFVGRILPASTLFAVTVPVSSMHEYLKSYNLYLEMHKKSGAFALNQKNAKGDNRQTPREWIDSLAIEELASAYCKFGEKCEWVTVLREKQQFGLNNVISAVVDRDKVQDPAPFMYKGYIASVFGEMFSHCNEEAFCKVGPWTIIGPKKVLEDFASGSTSFFTLEDYMDQTPAKGYMAREASVKIVANIKEGGDSLLKAIKPYYKGAFDNQMTRTNFEFLTADLGSVEGVPVMTVDFYASVLDKLPEPPRRGEEQQMTFAVDSTIVLPDGPFEVKDMTTKKAAYLEQLPNMRLRYLDANKKGVWAIPFETPICGYVEQIDLYNNGRLQMLFASGDKLYLLDRKGRFVKGYPAKLKKKVVMGPKLVKNVNGIKYSILLLNEDNTVSWCDVSGKPVAGWSDIVAPEFIKELPQFLKLGGKRYWTVKAPSQLLLYTIDGKRVEMQDKKKKIDRESEIVLVQDGVLKVKCTDGKEYTWNLATGKTKKCN